MTVRIFGTFLLSFTGLSFAMASPDSAAYYQAVQANAANEILKMQAPPPEIRETLLKQARAEDLTFVKSMLVYWKKNSTQNMAIEFNHVILHDERGTETFHMFPVENSPGKFEINGRVWTAPAAGSISVSLKKHLSRKDETASIFDLVSRAYADGENVFDQILAYYYFVAVNDPKFGEAAAKFLIDSKTAGHFEIQGNGIQWIFKNIFQGKAPEVFCGADSATGRIVIDNQPISFAVLKDGRVMLTPFASKRPFLASGSIGSYNGMVKYVGCADETCTQTTGEPRDRITSFLKLKVPEEADVAWTFVPRDGDQSTQPIVFDCPERTDCDRMFIRDREKLSARDRELAEGLVIRANRALAAAKAKQNSAIQAIRPLYACCMVEKCRAEVLPAGIRMKALDADKRKTRP